MKSDIHERVINHFQNIAEVSNDSDQDIPEEWIMDKKDHVKSQKINGYFILEMLDGQSQLKICIRIMLRRFYSFRSHIA